MRHSIEEQDRGESERRLVGSCRLWTMVPAASAFPTVVAHHAPPLFGLPFFLLFSFTIDYYVYLTGTILYYSLSLLDKRMRKHGYNIMAWLSACFSSFVLLITCTWLFSQASAAFSSRLFFFFFPLFPLWNEH